MSKSTGEKLTTTSLVNVAKVFLPIGAPLHVVFSFDFSREVYYKIRLEGANGNRNKNGLL